MTADQSWSKHLLPGPPMRNSGASGCPRVVHGLSLFAGAKLPTGREQGDKKVDSHRRSTHPP